MSVFRVETVTASAGSSGNVGIITFDRPPVNAITLAAYHELTELLHTFAAERKVGALILTAAGERAFCAGQDLKEAAGQSGAAVLARQQAVKNCLWAIYDHPQPIVAVLNGHAVGMGLMLASLCDVILAAEGVTFSLPEINVGLLGGGKLLSRMVPPHVARKMVLTGDRVPVERFQQWGSVDQVLPRAALMPAALTLAHSLAGKSADALRLAKQSLNMGEKLTLKEGYENEMVLGRSLSKH